jgi:hypothetical protein
LPPCSQSYGMTFFLYLDEFTHASMITSQRNSHKSIVRGSKFWAWIQIQVM